MGNSAMPCYPLLSDTDLVPAHVNSCSLSYYTYIGNQLFSPQLLEHTHRQFSLSSLRTLTDMCSTATCHCPDAIRILVPSVVLITWLNFPILISVLPMPVVAPSRAWVCRQSLAGIVGSNPIRIMDVCIFWVLSGRGLCDGPITRPVLSSVACLSMIAKLRTTGHDPKSGRSAQDKKKFSVIFSLKCSSLYCDTESGISSDLIIGSQLLRSLVVQKQPLVRCL